MTAAPSAQDVEVAIVTTGEANPRRRLPESFVEMRICVEGRFVVVLLDCGEAMDLGVQLASLGRDVGLAEAEGVRPVAGGR